MRQLKNNSSRFFKTCLGLVLGASILSGCSTSLSITKYPSFFSYPGEYASMAVTSEGNYGYPGDVVYAMDSSVVSSASNMNGYNYVLDYTHRSASDTLSSVRYEHSADLVAATRVTNMEDAFYEETRTRTIEYEVQDVDAEGTPLYDDDGNALTHTEYEEVPYPWFTRKAWVSGQVTVYSAETGEYISSSSSTSYCSDSDEFRDNLSSYSSLYRCAADDVGDDLARDITPHNTWISVQNSDLLVIGYVDNYGRLVEKTSGWQMGEEITFEVWFPTAARMNYFGFSIFTKAGKAPIVEEEIYWEAKGAIRFTYSIDELVAASGGEDNKFYAAIINRGTVAYDDSFKVELP